MTDGPERSPEFTTAAMGITLVSWVGGCTTGAGGGAAATAPVNTIGVTTTAKAVAGV